MNKQGAVVWQILMISYLILVAIIVVALVSKAKYVTSPEEYADAYSKIIALSIDSMLYSEYNPEVSLKIPSIFKVDILEDKVVVNFEDITKEYSYIPDNKFKIDVQRDADRLILIRNVV